MWAAEQQASLDTERLPVSPAPRAASFAGQRDSAAAAAAAGGSGGQSEEVEEMGAAVVNWTAAELSLSLDEGPWGALAPRESIDVLDLDDVELFEGVSLPPTEPTMSPQVSTESSSSSETGSLSNLSQSRKRKKPSENNKKACRRYQEKKRREKLQLLKRAEELQEEREHFLARIAQLQTAEAAEARDSAEMEEENAMLRAEVEHYRRLRGEMLSKMHAVERLVSTAETKRTFAFRLSESFGIMEGLVFKSQVQWEGSVKVRIAPGLVLNVFYEHLPRELPREQAKRFNMRFDLIEAAPQGENRAKSAHEVFEEALVQSRKAYYEPQDLLPIVGSRSNEGISELNGNELQQLSSGPPSINYLYRRWKGQNKQSVFTVSEKKGCKMVPVEVAPDASVSQAELVPTHVLVSSSDVITGEPRLMGVVKDSIEPGVEPEQDAMVCGCVLLNQGTSTRAIFASSVPVGHNGFHLLSGIDAPILPDGTMDEVLAQRLLRCLTL